VTRAAEPGSSAQVQGRPRAHTFTVEDLVAEVLAGRLRVPKFQRPLKWQQRDVLKLLDSIYCGYPIGTLLLWQRPAEVDHLIFGSVEIDAPARTDAWWVVDGQQRLLALTRALAGSGDQREPFAAYFDLHTQQFIRPPREPAPHQVPLTEVLDAERLMEWLLSRVVPLPTSERATAIRLGKRLREFQVPAYIVETDDERAVREIFRRANDTGKRMEDSDVFNALYSAGGSPASLREVSAQLDSPQLGTLDEGTLLRMLLANRGTDLSKDRIPDLSQEEAREAMAELARSARATLRFLVDDAAIPHLSLLPYQQPLYALSRFFKRHPDPHPRSRELLARWLWRGALTGAHNGNAISTREMLAAVGEDEHDSVQALLRGLPREHDALVDLDHFTFSHARSKIQLLALLDLQPVDLRTGVPVLSEPLEPVDPSEHMDSDGPLDPDVRIKRLIRPIFPHPPALATSLANRMIHPGLRSGLARAIENCEQPDRLASHAISRSAANLLRLGGELEFLNLRRAELLRQWDEFTARRAAWDEPDFPPVEALRVVNP
jgi:hypothetical protein